MTGRGERAVPIRASTFVIAANGFADGPAQALRDYLVAREALGVTVITHPLVAEGAAEHLVTEHSGGQTRTRRYRLPNRPPYTYLLDPFVPLRLARSTAWFGFNNLAALRGLLRRRSGRSDRVYYWAVDFVPRRFGRGLATRAYERVDRLVCSGVDARIELTETALRSRTEQLGLDPSTAAPAIVVPMGAWVARAPKASSRSWRGQRVVYLGHLVERQGVATMIEALPLLLETNPRATVEIVGGGPLEADLRRLASSLRVDDRVTFYGFVPDHRQVEAILGESAVAVAPYRRSARSFTRYADPGKLKAYLGAGLPIVMTDVPPNAGELRASGAASVIDDEPAALAIAVGGLLDSETRWLAAHDAAMSHARRFDWNTLLDESLGALGFDVGGADG